jgi:very-short-patch-repair endonuclease
MHRPNRLPATPAIITHHARQMRSALTPSEQQLWLAIRGGSLGVWFRRQVPLGRFIGDFVAVSARLVVEVDGGYHTRRRAADARRDRALQRLGYRVLRLDAALVSQRIQDAIAQIRAVFNPAPWALARQPGILHLQLQSPCRTPLAARHQ